MTSETESGISFDLTSIHRETNNGGTREMKKMKEDRYRVHLHLTQAPHISLSLGWKTKVSPIIKNICDEGTGLALSISLMNFTSTRESLQVKKYTIFFRTATEKECFVFAYNKFFEYQQNEMMEGNGQDEIDEEKAFKKASETPTSDAGFSYDMFDVESAEGSDDSDDDF